MKYPIIPALIPQDRDAVLQFTSTVAFCNEIQVDVVDGVFVPATSWPYEPAGEPKTIKHATDRFTLEVDLMVQEPVVAANAWIEAGADMLVFHVESLPLPVFKNFAERCTVSVGVSCHGDTSIETLLQYLVYADYTQLMGIREIGKQGEAFDEQVLETISKVKAAAPEKMISIDGSVNKQTIVRLKEAGADRFVAGSAIVGAEDLETAYRELVALVD